MKRNAAKTLPLTGVIILAAMLIAGIVAIMNSIPLSIRTIYSHSKHYLGITPRGNAALTPVFKKKIEKESPVELERIVIARASEIEGRSIVGPMPLIVLAVSNDDMHYYVNKMGGGAIEGRFPNEGEAGVIISEPLARNVGKKLGDILLDPDNSKFYSANKVKVVGVVKSEKWFCLAPIDYYRAYHFPPIDIMAIFAKNQKDQDKLGRWAENEFKGENSRVYAWHILERETDNTFYILYKILNVVIGILVVVITIMMAMLINIYQSQRIPEFGLLQALGYTKRKLLGRIMMETLLVVTAGWFLGMAFAWLMLTIIYRVLMYPNAFMLDAMDPAAYLYTIPVPICIFLAAIFTLFASFRKFDPVGVVERRLI